MAAFYTSSINLQEHTVALLIFPKLPLPTHDALGQQTVEKGFFKARTGATDTTDAALWLQNEYKI